MKLAADVPSLQGDSILVYLVTSPDIFCGIMRLKFQAEDNFKLAYLLRHTLKHRSIIFSKITILDFKMCFLVSEARSQYLKTGSELSRCAIIHPSNLSWSLSQQLWGKTITY